MKNWLLKKLYQRYPFSIEGDAVVSPVAEIAISCILPTYQRDEDLEILLHCLVEQDLPHKGFEVIVVEDGQTDNTRLLIQKFMPQLNLIHLTNPVPLNNVAQLRNQGLVRSRGELILWLDDDTIINQVDFLARLVTLFVADIDVGAVQVQGRASYGLWKLKYDYLDRYSFATRCVAYRKSVLARICGFSEELASYEDIELSIRFTIMGGRVLRSDDLYYLHPPLHFEGWSKPLSNGLSFLRLFRRYSKPVWFVCYLNALRFLPYLLWPDLKHRQWGKISVGFLWAPFYCGVQKIVGTKKKVIYR
ncbi:MAG: glycosyltransferase family 2 protein [Geopsychrobacter sp.]|nr:glycosyltransferase family 2 protein [Geopsychrobacter sp.]